MSELGKQKRTSETQKIASYPCNLHSSRLKMYIMFYHASSKYNTDIVMMRKMLDSLKKFVPNIGQKPCCNSFY